jgi:hypothetical protein
VPLSIRVAKVKAPDALIGRSAPPSFCNTSPEPESPRTVPPTVYVGGPESPPPHAVSIVSTATTEAPRAMLRIPDCMLIPSLVIAAIGNGGGRRDEHCTPMNSNPSPTWIDRAVRCHPRICRAKGYPLHESFAHDSSCSFIG